MDGYIVSASKKKISEKNYSYLDQWWSYTIHIIYRKKGLQKIP